MLIKVCGINDLQNFEAISELRIDMVGLNFYEPSKRYLGEVSKDMASTIQESTITKVGVFVNQSIDALQRAKHTYRLEYLQLHGGEDIKYCRKAREISKVIKVFGIDSTFDFCDVAEYDFCDLFLFDTKDVQHGGSGRKFEWKKLMEYKGSTPFLLAGGISPMDANEILDINHPALLGVDINSQFEVRPGVKDIAKVVAFSSILQSMNNKTNANRI